MLNFMIHLNAPTIVTINDWEETNYTPVVFDAYVDCWWNHSIDDYVWAFEAGVDHGNGYSEVSDVFVEIYQGRY